MWSLQSDPSEVSCIVVSEDYNASYKRNIMRELEEYESTKEHLMESITQDIQKECSEIENDTDLDFIGGGAKRKYD